MARLKYFIFHQNAEAASTGEILFIDDISNPDNAAIEITGTMESGLIKFEALTTPSGTWKPVAGLRASDFFLSTSTINSNEIWIFDLNSFYQFRINIDVIVNGSISIIGKVSKTI